MSGPDALPVERLRDQFGFLNVHPDDWALIEAFADEGFTIMALTEVPGGWRGPSDGGGA